MSSNDFDDNDFGRTEIDDDAKKIINEKIKNYYGSDVLKKAAENQPPPHPTPNRKRKYKKIYNALSIACAVVFLTGIAMVFGVVFSLSVPTSSSGSDSKITSSTAHLPGEGNYSSDFDNSSIESSYSAFSSNSTTESSSSAFSINSTTESSSPASSSNSATESSSPASSSNSATESSSPASSSNSTTESSSSAFSINSTTESSSPASSRNSTTESSSPASSRNSTTESSSPASSSNSATESNTSDILSSNERVSEFVLPSIPQDGQVDSVATNPDNNSLTNPNDIVTTGDRLFAGIGIMLMVLSLAVATVLNRMKSNDPESED